MERSEWTWMPHAAHLIVGNDCRFHLATEVGGHIVSTVGEYLPDEGSREIHAQFKGITLHGRGDDRRADFIRKCGYVEIGLDRTYETMVFPSRPDDSGCCPFRPNSYSELDFEGYGNAPDAFNGHLAMCEKWAAMPIEVPA